MFKKLAGTDNFKVWPSSYQLQNGKIIMAVPQWLHDKKEVVKEMKSQPKAIDVNIIVVFKSVKAARIQIYSAQRRF